MPLINFDDISALVQSLTVVVSRGIELDASLSNSLGWATDM
jgi:hypothetical protein